MNLHISLTVTAGLLIAFSLPMQNNSVCLGGWGFVAGAILAFLTYPRVYHFICKKVGR